jgi:hypothetical protein
MGAYGTLIEQPTNFTSTTPAAPAGAINIIPQAEAPTPPPTTVVRHFSAYVPAPTTSTPGCVPALPNDATQCLDGTGNWSAKGSGGGGGGLPADAMVTLGVRGTGSNAGWVNWTVAGIVFAESVMLPANSFKARLSVIGGSGISIAAAALIKTARGSTTALSVTPITFGGNSSYVAAFSGVSASNPLYLDTDVISAVSIDQNHDHYFLFYFNSDSHSYNSALVLYSGEVGGYAINNGHTGGNTIPSVGGTVTAVVGAGSNAPLVVAIIAESSYTGS